MCQPPLGMAFLRPRIAKIDIEPSYFAGSENPLYVVYIEYQQPHILQVPFPYLSGSAVEYILLKLYAYKIDLREPICQFTEEIALPCPQFHMDWHLPAKDCLPGSLQFLAILLVPRHNKVIELMYSLVNPGLSSQTQDESSFQIFFTYTICLLYQAFHLTAIHFFKINAKNAKINVSIIKILYHIQK